MLISFFRRRKISSNKRQWEQSYSRPEQSIIVWPAQTPVSRNRMNDYCIFQENIELLTTLYKGVNDEHFDDKVNNLSLG